MSQQMPIIFVVDDDISVRESLEALIKFAGGHDPGPLAVEAQESQAQVTDPSEAEGTDAGPWGDAPQSTPQPDPWGPEAGPPAGPWGPRRG